MLPTASARNPGLTLELDAAVLGVQGEDELPERPVSEVAGWRPGKRIDVAEIYFRIEPVLAQFDTALDFSSPDRKRAVRGAGCPNLGRVGCKWHFLQELCRKG